MDRFSSTHLRLFLAAVKKGPHAFLLPLILLVVLISGCTSGVYHTVKPGQTLYRISRTYHIDEDYLARVNGIYDPSQISVGTRIFIPGADRVRHVPTVSAPSTATKSTRKVVTKPTTKKASRKTTPVHKPAVGKTAPPKATKGPAKQRATQLKKLQWPLRGKVLRTFSSKVKAGRGRGIEIAARPGTVVRAAEAGKVIYSGDGVNGYGYLVILQHENDLFTVYGFNRKSLVKQGDFVSRGEKLALSGTPPAGGQPRLHFEVRKGKRAVNPMSYLP